MGILSNIHQVLPRIPWYSQILTIMEPKFMYHGICKVLQEYHGGIIVQIYKIEKKKTWWCHGSFSQSAYSFTCYISKGTVCYNHFYKCKRERMQEEQILWVKLTLKCEKSRDLTHVNNFMARLRRYLLSHIRRHTYTQTHMQTPWFQVTVPLVHSEIVWQTQSSHPQLLPWRRNLQDQGSWHTLRHNETKMKSYLCTCTSIS